MRWIPYVQASWLVLLLPAGGCYFFEVLLSGCVVEGTLIATPSGVQPVETLRVGDEVLSRAPDGSLVANTVTTTHAHVASEVLVIDTGTCRLVVTDRHPVATPTGWVRAGDLQVGDVVETRDGRSEVTALSREHKRRRVYDLAVADHANFFAGGILVHNKSVSPPRLVGNWGGTSENGAYYLLVLEETGWSADKPRPESFGRLVRTLDGQAAQYAVASWGAGYDRRFSARVEGSGGEILFFRGKAGRRLSETDVHAARVRRGRTVPGERQRARAVRRSGATFSDATAKPDSRISRSPA